jgi:pimeloyl-ACP methyl ester carboxylesterase
MAPVAMALSGSFGVLEPLQSSRSVQGQINELYESIRSITSRPIVLAGHSWGAWLSCLCAAQHPDIARKLILISSGPFDDKYVDLISKRRIMKLDDDEAAEYIEIPGRLYSGRSKDPDADLARLGSLCRKSDIYEMSDDAGGLLLMQAPCVASADIHSGVWPEAEKLRSSGMLLKSAGLIACPVVIIHGIDDPHPCEGVVEPLSLVIENIECHILERCGHYPWLEKHASDRFLEIMSGE